MEESSFDVYFFIPTWVIILFCALAVFQIITLWKVFTKAGQPGWASLIPIYNIYIMTKIAGKPGIWVLWMIIPFVNFVFGIWLVNMISKSFGHEEGFTAGLIFLGFIFWPILAFGPSKYLGPYGNPAAFQAYQGKEQFDFENTQQ